MKTPLLSFIFLLFTFFCFAQQESDTLWEQPLEEWNFPYPTLWVKAGECVPGMPMWQDVTGNGYRLVPQSGMLPDTFSRLNFNPAFYMENDYFTAPDFSFRNSDITGMIVYRITDSLNEQALWSVKIDSVSWVGLTTQRMLHETGAQTYTEENEMMTIVNTLFRSWESRGDSIPNEFFLLYADSLPFSGDIAECLLFDWSLDYTTLVQYISYLSLKYGITLFETDYLDGHRRVVWDYQNYPEYSYSIAGLGKDSVTGLEQRQSYMMDNRIIVAYHEIAPTNEENPTILTEGNFLVWGFDSARLNKIGMLHFEDGFEIEMYGNGLLQRTDSLSEEAYSEINTEMRVDGTGWKGNPANYYLLIDRSGTGEFLKEDIVFYMPLTVDSNYTLYFSGIEWDSDGNGKDRFCFTYVPIDSLLEHRISLLADSSGKRESYSLLFTGDELSAALNSGDDSWGSESNFDDDSQNQFPLQELTKNNYQLYPNPSTGYFTLKVDYWETSPITVKLYSPEGKLLQVNTGKDSQHYQFNYHVRVSGQYLLEIIGGGEQKTLKLIINN